MHEARNGKGPRSAIHHPVQFPLLMELPIAPQQNQPSPDAMVRAVRRARMIVARMVGEETALGRATAFTNRDRPGVRLANCAFEVEARQEGNEPSVLREIKAHFEQHGVTCHTIDAGAADWPPALVSQFESGGYGGRKKTVFLMRDYRRPAGIHEDLQVIPARAAYGELRPFYESMARSEFGADHTLATDFAAVMIDRLDEARLELFLGRLDGRPVGVAGVVTLGNIGVFDPAYTDPEHRGKGIGAAMAAHTFDHCQRALFEQVLIERSEGCVSIPFYEALGFERAAEFVRYAAEEDETTNHTNHTNHTNGSGFAGD